MNDLHMHFSEEWSWKNEEGSHIFIVTNLDIGKMNNIIDHFLRTLNDDTEIIIYCRHLINEKNKEDTLFDIEYPPHFFNNYRELSIQRAIVEKFFYERFLSYKNNLFDLYDYL